MIDDGELTVNNVSKGFQRRVKGEDVVSEPSTWNLSVGSYQTNHSVTLLVIKFVHTLSSCCSPPVCLLSSCQACSEIVKSSYETCLVELQSVERAMAVACMMGECTGAGMYPTKEELVYWRAVYEGMERPNESGEKHDPMIIFKTRNNYNYCATEHLKACSSKRGELSGAKGIRGVFEAKTSFNLARAKGVAALTVMRALGDTLTSKEIPLVPVTVMLKLCTCSFPVGIKE